MIEILLIIIIILLAPWLLDLALVFSLLAIVVITVIFAFLYLNAHYPELISKIMPTILVVTILRYIIYNGFVKHIIDGYNSKD